MKAPTFWYTPDERPPFFVWIPLRILEGMYDILRRLHIWLSWPRRVSVPVICVGNATVGGSGKTPVVRALTHLLNQPDLYILSRGYGGHDPGPTLVKDTDSADQVGDETLLLLQEAPVVISRHRLKGARLITKIGGRFILMDDGLQNRKIKPDINILVIDGSDGFGNGHLIPAGPLREPPGEVWPRIDLVICIDTDKRGVRQYVPHQIPIFAARRVEDLSALHPQKQVIAFAGIARPDNFFKSLESRGFTLKHKIPFPDHYAYDQRDIEDLLRMTHVNVNQLVTTEKDAVKLPKRLTEGRMIAVVPLKIVFDEPEYLRHVITQRLRQKRHK